jgi:hypothetical protein
MDLIAKLRKALGLEDSADEAAVLSALEETVGNAKVVGALRELDGLEIAEDADVEAITEVVKKAISEDKGEEKTLEEQAEAAGKKVVTASDYDQLVANATKGAEAAEDLRVSKFDTAFDQALEGLRVDAKPETKERLRKFYDVAPEECLAHLENAPKIANAEGKGSGEGEGDVPDGVDEDSYKLDQRVKAHMKEHKVKDYAEALDAVLEEAAA